MPLIAPFGIDAVAARSAYARGVFDASAPPVQIPAAAALPPQKVDRIYRILPGSSLNLAIAQAQKDKSQWPSFQFMPGSTYSCSLALPKGFAGISLSGGDTLQGAAVIESDTFGPGDAAIAVLGLPNVRISNLTFNARPSAARAVPARAIYANGSTALALDHVVINGFAIGFCSDGGDSTVVTNSGFFNQSAPKLAKSQGVFHEAATGTWRMEGNTFFHCGWAEADYDASTPASIKAGNDLLQLNHGIYLCNNTGKSVDGSIRGNLFVDCASRGINSRVGGLYDFNVFRSNGQAADVVIQGITGVVASSVFLGPVVDKAPYFGGGVEGISQQLTVADSYFFIAANTPQNPSVQVSWPASNGALPAGVTATLSNLRIMGSKSLMTLSGGRTATPKGISFVPVPAGTPLPSLELFYGCDAAGLENVLRSRVGNGSMDAAALLDWSARSFGVMTAGTNG